MPLDDVRKEIYDRHFAYNPTAMSQSAREILYLDTKPPAIEVQIPLVETFERIKRHRADRWQINLCNHLQNAAVNRHVERWWGIIHAEGQLGKPLDVETTVHMADGSYKPLGDVAVNDQVITHIGRPRTVKRVFEQGELECLRIRTNSGREVVSALDHPFLTPEGWRLAKDLKVGQALGIVPEPLTLGLEQRSIDEFEMLGYFIGDGCVTRTRTSINAGITSGDPEQAARILDLADRFDWGHRISRKPGAKCLTYNFTGGVRDWLRGAGIAGLDSWSKHVPEWVFRGSDKKVAAFLGAYFSCDGGLGENRDANGAYKLDKTIDFGSVSIQLLKDVQKLLLRVGVHSRLAIKNGVYKGSRHQSHRLYFCSQDLNAQFAAKVPIAGRKGTRLLEHDRFRKTFQPQLFADPIVFVEPVGKRPCRCLEVDEDNTFTANDFVVHNTSIISQVFPAWLIGHDPLFRFALAMYNVTKSQMHSAVVIQIMQSTLYKDMFPNTDGWLFADYETHSKVGRVTSKAGWFTNARRELNDGQQSFNPVGLISGLVGAGFDWLGIDDPYRDARDAFSEQIRNNLQNFYDSTVMSRVGLHSCISGMFHRYAPEDLAGYLLDTGDFEYLRYASECDGDYIHESTGKRYPDPLDRKEGELISPDRRPARYYEKARKNNRMWLSMFQGRPSSEEGDFFNVGRIGKLAPDLAEERKRECVALVRPYDQAATAEESGAYTVGPLMGIRNDGRVTIFEMYRERVDTAARLAAQKANAVKDGPDVTITVPKDPGSAGKDVVWMTKQHLKEYIVDEMETSGSKESRAYPYSIAVNSGLVDFVEADWNKDARRELRDFPLSEYKDITDAMSDGYTWLERRRRKGRLVTGFRAERNLVNWVEFGKMFPYRNAKGKKVLKVPDSFTIYAGVKVSSDASLPTCACIVARASVNTELEDTLFILGEYKEYDADPYRCFEWLEKLLRQICKRTDPENTTVWLHPASLHFAPTIRQKINVSIAEFKGDEFAGYAELNWYFIPTDNPHPTNAAEKAARMYALIKPGRETNAHDRDGMYSLRQEIRTCGFNDKGEPAATCQVLDVLRMCVSGFSTTATPLSRQERYEKLLGQEGIVRPDEEIDVARQQQILDARARAKRKLLAEEEGEDFDELEDL